MNNPKPKQNRFKIGIVIFLLVTYTCILTIDGTLFQSVNAQSPLIGTINGLVTQSTNGREISGARIELKRGDDIISSALSSTDGEFTITAPAGDYDLFVSKMGFKAIMMVISIPANEILTLDLELSPILLGNSVNLSIKSSGAQAGIFKKSKDGFGFLSGVVIGKTTGLPIQDALISLKNEIEGITTDVTDGDGTFFIEALPGVYDLSAEKEGFVEKTDKVLISAFNKTDQGLVLSTDENEPTPTPDPSPTSNVGPTPVITETPLPGVTECEGGGVPSRIRISQRLLIMPPKSGRIIRIHVWKGRRKACVTDVKVNCIRGCEKIMFEDKVITNKRGFARLGINTLDSRPGIAVLSITAGKVVRYVRIVIRPSVISLDDEQAE